MRYNVSIKSVLREQRKNRLMKTSYDYYLIGCRTRGFRPVSAWRFKLAYTKYQAARLRELLAALPLDPRKRSRAMARWHKYFLVGELVRVGQDIAARAKSNGASDDDEPGAAGLGVREPRSPVTPILVGCASCALPGAWDTDSRDAH